MSTQILLTLKDEMYRRAQYMAELTGQNIEEVLTDSLDISLPPLSKQTNNGKPISELSDSEVLALADSQMEPTQNRRFSELLDKKQATKLDDNDQSELMALLQVYQIGLLRKAQALSESVRRGLREPMEG